MNQLKTAAAGARLRLRDPDSGARADSRAARDWQVAQ